MVRPCVCHAAASWTVCQDEELPFQGQEVSVSPVSPFHASSSVLTCSAASSLPLPPHRCPDQAGTRLPVLLCQLRGLPALSRVPQPGKWRLLLASPAVTAPRRRSLLAVSGMPCLGLHRRGDPGGEDRVPVPSRLSPAGCLRSPTWSCPDQHGPLPRGLLR